MLNSPASYCFWVSFSNHSTLVSSLRRCSFGCTVNKFSSKSRKSLIIFIPQLLERAMYAWNPLIFPKGGFARSATMLLMVWPWDLKSVRAYAGVSDICSLSTCIPELPLNLKLVYVRNMGMIPSGKPGNFILRQKRGLNRTMAGGYFNCMFLDLITSCYIQVECSVQLELRGCDWGA